MLVSRCSAKCAVSVSLPRIQTMGSVLRRHSYGTEAKLGPDEDHAWWPSHPVPTPYQIFCYSQQTPYSKSRYYQLVKLYHPDHAQHRRLGISEAVRVERFRLIVAANAILSDPEKRAAYDRFGLGWNTGARGGGSRKNPRWWAEREGHGPCGLDEHYGKGGQYDPSRNATWEDWEKYYQRKAAAAQGGGGAGAGDSGKRYYQETIYTSNRAFIAIVAFLASLGGLANISRANINAQQFLDEADNRSARINRDLRKRREEAAALGGKDERIQAFLKLRDPIGYDPREKCDSGGIQKGD